MIRKVRALEIDGELSSGDDSKDQAFRLSSDYRPDQDGRTGQEWPQQSSAHTAVETRRIRVAVIPRTKPALMKSALRPITGQDDFFADKALGEDSALGSAPGSVPGPQPPRQEEGRQGKAPFTHDLADKTVAHTRRVRVRFGTFKETLDVTGRVGYEGLL